MKKANFGAFLGFFIFICFSTGIVISRFISSFWFLVCLAALSFLAAGYFYRKKNVFASDAAILVIFIFLGAAWSVSHSFYHNKKPFLNKNYKFSLKIVSLPKVSSLRNTCKAKIYFAGSQPVSFSAFVADYSKKLEYLNHYEVTGKLTENNYHGKALFLWVRKNSKVKKLPLTLTERITKTANKYILRVFEKNCDQQSCNFLAAVFLGRRELIGLQKDIFAKAGVSHLLAISGLHIGLTALLLFFFLKIAGFSHKACLIFSLLLLSWYTLLTGVSASTLRALIMYAVFVCGFLLRRKTKLLNSLGLAGLFILIWDPEMLFNPGFQLSFASVLAIIIGFKIFGPVSEANPAYYYLKQIFLCSLFVTLLITPIVSYYFGRVYLLNIIYNLLLIPFFTLILGLNFFLVAFSFFPFIAKALGALLSLIISLFIQSTSVLSSSRFSFIECRFSIKTMVIYYTILSSLAGLLFALKRKVPKAKEAI
ncbi:MAG: ComEC/Rec2 family competence protein [Candidatus Omnitrophica bacterium]|nr:ComEC/Rec2 family competence protein [Candidatus Omnitrophota bacterium]MDD5429235.1 ComEC/Rec2 family competence protein [Candidatus Omnitrophota bacterium]